MSDINNDVLEVFLTIRRLNQRASFGLSKKDKNLLPQVYEALDNAVKYQDNGYIAEALSEMVRRYQVLESGLNGLLELKSLDCKNANLSDGLDHVIEMADTFMEYLLTQEPSSDFFEIVKSDAGYAQKKFGHLPAMMKIVKNVQDSYGISNDN